MTCSDSFSRDGLALFGGGGRTSGSLGRRPAVGKRLDNADAERSESDGSETIEDAEALCFAGLLISRLKSRCPLASRSLRADGFKGLVAEKDREVWSVRAGGMGLWRDGERDPDASGEIFEEGKGSRDRAWGDERNGEPESDNEPVLRNDPADGMDTLR